MFHDYRGICTIACTSRKMVRASTSFREAVERRDPHRLIEPTEESEVSASESVSQDKLQAVFLAFLHSSTELIPFPFPRIELQELDPEKVNALRVISARASLGKPFAAGGSHSMHRGIDVSLRCDFQAVGFVWKVQP